MASGETSAVRVAVRLRPQSANERIAMCSKCLFCAPDGHPQVMLGKNKAFTFDHVFDEESRQEDIYSTCIEKLVEGCFEGLNATVFAYGQTGSGKTYTMGSGFDMAYETDTQGIIPRAVAHLFHGIRERQKKATAENRSPPTFQVQVQFLELYNEQIKDLFDPTQRVDNKNIHIHEDSYGGIYLRGATTKVLTSENETLTALRDGALCRTVGSTNMNAQSSRSHAIFTLHVRQERMSFSESTGGSLTSETGERSITPTNDGEVEVLTAKFHFVDLAGSERLKRTGATGERAKEGISINCGLLALGNVISALGDKAKRGGHVPYRDSKLTRLLQDSLGGNSCTLMIACVSPSDQDFMETLNTLMYANRAKNIKNKVVVNQDQASQQLGALRNRIRELELELAEFKSGRMVVSEDGKSMYNDMVTENTMLRADNDKLRVRLKAMQEVIDSQNERLADLQVSSQESLVREDTSTGQLLGAKESGEGMSNLIQGYLRQIENLKSQLVLSESLAHQSPKSPYRRAPSTFVPYGGSSSSMGPPVPSIDLNESCEDVLALAKSEIAKINHKIHKKRSSTDEQKVQLLPSKGSPNPAKDRSSTSTSNDGSKTDDELDPSGCEDEDSANDSGSDSSVSSDEYDSESLQEDLATLSSEINIKQKLIDQLEGAQRTMQAMKKQYEEKLQTLHIQINKTESERDRVLRELSHKGSVAEEKTKEIKATFQKQIEKMQMEVKQLKIAKKEHQKALKQQASTDKELKAMKKDLDEMKKQRVKLMHKMREDANRNRQAESKRMKEIAQLRKDGRRKDNVIKTLEAEQRKRDAVLRRKQEEVKALRKIKTTTQPPLPKPSFVTQGRSESLDKGMISKGVNRRKSSIFSSESARHLWREMERKVRDIISFRRTVAGMEEELDRHFKRREELHKKMESTKALISQSVFDERSDDDIGTVEEEQALLQANLDYIQQMITDKQGEIVCMMESKGEGDTIEVSTIIRNSSVREAKYLLEHFLDMSINSGLKAELKEAEAKDLSGRLVQLESQIKFMNMMNRGRQSRQPFESHMTFVSDTEPQSSSQLQSGPVKKAQVQEKEKKHRRRTALPKELMAYTSNESVIEACSSSNEDGSQELSQEPVTTSPLPGIPEIESDVPASPTPSRANEHSIAATVVKKRQTRSSVSSVESVSYNHPGSPTRLIRTSETNVFTRLTSNRADAQVKQSENKGLFRRSDSKTRNISGPLVCSHQVTGHRGEVFSVCATNDLLFSASKDRTVKVWDLGANKEISTLSNHPSYVRKVAYSEGINVLFSASQTTVKLWDMREGGHHIQSFNQGKVDPDPSSILDMLVVPDGRYLYSSGGSSVIVWDLRKMSCIGRLTGHAAPVQSIVYGEDVMVTGSRDRRIKIFDYKTVLESLGNQESTCLPIQTLCPPHYDAVSSMALWNKNIFSACGVSIKLWSLENYTNIQSIDGAQTNPITSLVWLPQNRSLISGCKGGELKVWAGTTKSNKIQFIGSVTVSKYAINSVAANSYNIFTGSADRTIRVWRMNPGQISL